LFFLVNNNPTQGGRGVKSCVCACQPTFSLPQTACLPSFFQASRSAKAKRLPLAIVFRL
jgi:hypothetical protein